MRECVENEIKAGCIRKSDKVLIIGCGSFPATATIIAELIGSEITAIDNRRIEINLAKKYIKKIGLNKVLIEYGDGCNYSVKDFNVIVVNSSVHPRGKVFDIIFQTSRKGCRVIIRELKLTKQLFIRFISKRNDFVLEKVIDHPNNWCSCIIRKQ